MKAELDAMLACPDPDYRLPDCKAWHHFVRNPSEPIGAGGEDVLVAALRRPKDRFRVYLIARLAQQPGPRNADPERVRAALAALLAIADPDQTRSEPKWIGIAIGALPLDGGVREEIERLVAEHSIPEVAGAVVMGLGMAHPRDRAVLDFVDRHADDPRPAVRSGVVEAYAEARDRDLPRACAAWSRAMADTAPGIASRAEAMISVFPGCRKYQAAVLAAAEKRLRADVHASASVLRDLCSNRALRGRIVKLATWLVPRVGRGEWLEPLEAIARCHPSGPAAAMRRWIAKEGDIGHAARRALDDATRSP